MLYSRFFSVIYLIYSSVYMPIPEIKPLYMPTPLKYFIQLTHLVSTTIFLRSVHYHLHCTSGETEAKRNELAFESHTASQWCKGLGHESVHLRFLIRSL